MSLKCGTGCVFSPRPPKSIRVQIANRGSFALLPSTDTIYLAERGVNHSVTADANMTCIVIPAFPLPPGYDRSQSDLLLRFNAGYPDVPPDMWWFNPPV